MATPSATAALGRPPVAVQHRQQQQMVRQRCLSLKVHAANTKGQPTERVVTAPRPADVFSRFSQARGEEVELWGAGAHDMPFTPARREVQGPLELLQGQVPKDFPSGAYLRNGPNHPFPDQRDEDHVFDANGMVHAAVFSEDGEGQYFNRYVNTSSHIQEQKAGRKLFSGVMCRSGFRMLANIVGNALTTGRTFKDTANTGLLYFNNRLLALMEASKPYEMRFAGPEERLQTVPSYYDFDGQLTHPMTAHPKVCPKTGEVMAFGYATGSSPYMFYSVFSSNGTRLLTQGIDLDKPVMTHDMAITENYTILLDLPLVFDTSNIMRNKFPFGYDPNHPARIGLVPRYGGKVEWFPVKSCNVFHTVNAYEDEDTGEVVLHGCRYECDNDPYFAYNPAYMYEWRLTPGSNGSRGTERLMDSTPLEYPKINNEYTGMKYKYAYASGVTSLGKLRDWSNPSVGISFSNMLKYDMDSGTVVDSWRPTDGSVFGEAEFVPRAGSSHKPAAGGSCSPEDDGYLVMFGSNLVKRHSFVAILDASNLSQGPVALLKTPQPVPSGLHGTWVPGEAMESAMSEWFSTVSAS